MDTVALNNELHDIEKSDPRQYRHPPSVRTWKSSRPRVWQYIAIATTVVVLFSGCASWDKLVQKPTASFTNMHLRQADLTEGTAVFNFDINNPIPIRAGRITYNLKLNDRDFVSGEIDQGMNLAAGSTSRLSVPITLQYLDFFDSLSQLWKAKGAKYTLTGGFVVGPFTIPFQAHGNFDLPKIPKVSLENVKIDKLSPAGAHLGCRLKMDNPNAFQLVLKRLDYHLKLGNTTFARASALPEGPIAADSAAAMNFGFDISFAQLGYSAYQLLLGAGADYRLEGAMVFDSSDGKEKHVPMTAAGRIPFLR